MRYPLSLTKSCPQDSFHKQVSGQQDPRTSLLARSTARLHAARNWFELRGIEELTVDEDLIGVTKKWLTSKTPEDGLSVQYLYSIANIRFGLVVTSQFLHEIYEHHTVDGVVNGMVS